MAALFAIPRALAATAELADRIQYSMADLGYRFPDYPVPPGETAHSFLRALTLVGRANATGRFTIAPAPRSSANWRSSRSSALPATSSSSGTSSISAAAGDSRAGRGSAANSAVCYSLGSQRSIRWDELLFERFLSEERGEWPDIDLDLPSGDRRERVIQHVYEKYAGTARR